MMRKTQTPIVIAAPVFSGAALAVMSCFVEAAREAISPENGSAMLFFGEKPL